MGSSLQESFFSIIAHLFEKNNCFPENALHKGLFGRNTGSEVILMAKQGMKRPDCTKLHPKNEASPVPEIQGKAKADRKKENPIIAGARRTDMKVFHRHPYREFGNELAAENLLNDVPPEDQ